MKKHNPPSLLHPFTTIQTPPQGRKENAPKPPKNSPTHPKNSPKTPLNHPYVTFRPIKPYHPPFACNTNVASMLHYIRFVFFRPMSFHTPNPLSINANHDFTASSCYVRFVLCPVKVEPNFAVWRAKQVAFASHLSPSVSQQKKFWRKTYLCGKLNPTVTACQSIAQIVSFTSV